MPEPQLTSEQQQFVEEMSRVAAQHMRAGIASNLIEMDLMERGLDAESTRVVVGNLNKAMAKARSEVAETRRKTGQRNMLFGALWCIGGAAVTAITYSAATSLPGGGPYLVARGAILFGAIQFLFGAIQFVRGLPQG